MKHGIKSEGFAVLLVVLLTVTRPLNGQELEPRAYSVSPVGINIALYVRSVNFGLRPRLFHRKEC